MVTWYNVSIKVWLFLPNFCKQNLVIYVGIHAIGNFVSGMDFHMQILLWFKLVEYSMLTNKKLFGVTMELFASNISQIFC